MSQFAYKEDFLCWESHNLYTVASVLLQREICCFTFKQIFILMAANENSNTTHPYHWFYNFQYGTPISIGQPIFKILHMISKPSQHDFMWNWLFWGQFNYGSIQSDVVVITTRLKTMTLLVGKRKYLQFWVPRSGWKAFVMLIIWK